MACKVNEHCHRHRHRCLLPSLTITGKSIQKLHRLTWRQIKLSHTQADPPRLRVFPSSPSPSWASKECHRLGDRQSQQATCWNTRTPGTLVAYAHRAMCTRWWLASSLAFDIPFCAPIIISGHITNNFDSWKCYSDQVGNWTMHRVVMVVVDSCL